MAEDLIIPGLQAPEKWSVTPGGRPSGPVQVDVSPEIRDREVKRREEKARRAEARARRIAEKRRQQREQEEKAAAAIAAAREASKTPGDRAAERGRADFKAGMDLVAESGRKRSVRVDNPTHEAVKQYTDTMGTGAQRKGLFTGAPQQAQAPVQVVVNTPQAEPAPQGVPEAAKSRGVPGEIPETVVPDEAAPLDIDEEAEAAAEAVEAAAEAADPQPEMPSEGVLQRTVDAAEGLAQAKVNAEQDKADAMSWAADQQRAAFEESKRVEQEQLAKVDAQLRARQAAEAEVAKATEGFQKLKTLDPKDAPSAFANQKVGRKILTLIGLAAGGFTGRNDTAAALRQAVEDDVAAAQAEIAKAGADLDAAKTRSSEAAKVYADTLAAVGDQRVARQVTELARMQDIKSTYEARLAQEGVKVLSSEQEALLVGLEQDIAQRQMAIDVQAARNPAQFVKTISVYDKGQRSAMREAGKRLMDSGIEGVESAEKFAQQDRQTGLKHQGAMELEDVKQRGAVAAKRAEGQAKSDMEIKKASAKWGIVEQMGRDFLAANQDEIHGSGIPLTGSQGERMSVKNFLAMYPEMITTAVTGAVADEDQKEIFQELVQGDWKEWGDDLLRRRIQEIVNLASANRRYLQNELGSSRVDVVNPEEMSTFQPR